MVVKTDVQVVVHVIVCMHVRMIAQEHAKDAKAIAMEIVSATVKKHVKVVVKNHVAVVALILVQEVQNCDINGSADALISK